MPQANFIQKGDTIDYPNASGSDIAYGDVVPLTTRIGVAGEKITNGSTGSMHLAGCFELPAVNNAAFAVGAQLYWDSSAKKLTTTSSGNTPAGACVKAKAETGTVAIVKID